MNFISLKRNWIKTKLGNVAEEIRELVEPNKTEAYPYIGLEHIEQQTLKLKDVGSSDDVVSTKKVFKEGDILFGSLRPYFRKVVRPTFSGVCSTDITVIRAKDNTDTAFLYYFIASQDFIDYSTNISSGTRMPRASWKVLSESEWYFPPLSTQRKIASILTAYDELIENNLRRIKILEEMAQALYREWFVHYRFPGHEKVRLVDSPLGKNPEGWEVMNLGDLLIDHIGGGWGKEEKDSKHTCQAFVIRGTDIPHVKFIDIGNCPLRFHSESNLCSRKLQPGDLVYEVSGGGKEQPVGRVLLITEKILAAFPGDVICASFCKRMTPNVDYINPLILFYHLDNLYKSERINQYQVQSTGIKNLKFSILLENEFVTVPLLKLQNQFIEIISPIKEAQENFALRNTVIRRTRDLLLPKLISGELDVSRLDIKIPEELD